MVFVQEDMLFSELQNTAFLLEIIKASGLSADVSN